MRFPSRLFVALSLVMLYLCGSGGTKSWDLDSLQSERVSGDSTDGYYEKELDLAADQHPSGEFSISLRQVGDLEGNITTMEIEEGYPLTIVNNSQ